jgi:8-oxo-dGTP diphosphatase
VAGGATRSHSLEVIDRLYRFALLCGYHALRASRRFRNPLTHGAYVAVWRGQRLLIIRNSYKPGETMPAGGLKRGESYREAARRELAEEVGIDVEADRLEFACELEIHGRYGRDRSQFFELHLERDPEVKIDRREVVWWTFCPAQELAKRPLIRIVRRYLEQRPELPHHAQ